MKKHSLTDLQRISVDDFKQATKTPIVIVLDNVRSLHNVGSVFRTADAFRLQAIYLCGITATPPNKEIHKTALGSTESVAWQYFSQTTAALQQLKAANYRVIAVEQTDSSLLLPAMQPQASEQYALVFGNEVYGVSDEALTYCEQAIEVPQIGTKHSLNISVCMGIVVWDFVSKWQIL